MSALPIGWSYPMEGHTDPPNMKVYPTKKKATKPKPKIAKFVLTTWAACFARQKPVSTSAKPACMKITSTAPITTHSKLTSTAAIGSGTASWANAGVAVRSSCCSHHPRGR